MPKFNPRQQQKKLRRHNPIARAAPAIELPPSSSSSSGAKSNGSSDALPILANLPLPSSSSSPASIQEDEKVLRALQGLNPLLLAKPSRNILLEPKHKLISRLVHLVDHARLEVRKEAAGCLRNLCVEAKWAVREQIWQHQGGARALAQAEYAARELGLLPKSQEHADTASAAPVTSAPAKKPEEMNRKERRHAAKAAKAAGTTAASDDADAAPVKATPASAAAEMAAHELLLLHLSLLENHLTIIWCLLEGVSSPVWLTTLNRSILSTLLCPCISTAAQAFSQPYSTNKITQKEEIEVRTAQVEVASTAANLLATWLEDNAAGAATLAGLPLDLVEQVEAFEQAGNTAEPGSKGRKRLEMIFDKFAKLDAEAQRRAKDGVDALTASFEAMIAGEDNANTNKLNYSKPTLGLLALASCCNLVESLPIALRAWVPSSSGSLAQWQLSTAAPKLLNFVTTTSADEGLWKSLETASTQPREKVELAEAAGMEVDDHHDDHADEQPKSTRALARLDDLTLAVELLGEICAEAGVQPGDDGALLPPEMAAAQAKNGEGNGMDEDDIDETQDDDLDSEEEEEMLALADADRESDDGGDAQGDVSMEASNKKKKVGRGDAGDSTWSASPYAQLVSKHHLPTALLKLLVAPTFSNAHVAELSQPFLQATHGALAALLSGLSAHAKPPPSQPVEEGSKEARRVAQYQRWVSSEASSLSETWQGLKESAQAADQSLDNLVAIWTGLSSLLVMHEGMEALAFDIQAADLQTFFGASLDRALAVKGDEVAASVSSLIISSFGNVARVPQASCPLIERNRFACELWLKLLASANDVPPPALLSALNAFIDTYADETSQWDQEVFVAGGVLGGVKACVPGVRERIRSSVDKRKEAALRERLDEAMTNLMAFIEYRESLAA
ncbi:hypothetical protein BDZ90DRAFT_234429 [Jaminaea rosea]|uniref:SYO1-like TPR repeats domain-containing protein n=1 Tax=Jaminaea rosea TaxID=1569628 RepID=A0A316UJ39_9BASI|nr:hypothetical protein BDZ90DRAFT_234429 [Jaminaea rosea]PWN25229.1 hypothetical protein BDZ90DRAFT_234429 [Jaminaea rosea]